MYQCLSSKRNGRTNYEVVRRELTFYIILILELYRSLFPQGTFSLCGLGQVGEHHPVLHGRLRPNCAIDRKSQLLIPRSLRKEFASAEKFKMTITHKQLVEVRR